MLWLVCGVAAGYFGKPWLDKAVAWIHDKFVH